MMSLNLEFVLTSLIRVKSFSTFKEFYINISAVVVIPRNIVISNVVGKSNLGNLGI